MKLAEEESPPRGEAIVSGPLDLVYQIWSTAGEATVSNPLDLVHWSPGEAGSGSGPLGNQETIISPHTGFQFFSLSSGR